MKDFWIKLYATLNKYLPYDKLLHFTVGAGICYIILAILVLTNSMFYFSLFACLAVLITLAIGGLKELIDEKIGSKADITDVLATFIGALVSVGLILLTKVIFV